MAELLPTPTPQELQGDARLAMAEALGQHPDFTLPEPLTRCGRCGDHAAFFGPDDDWGYVCGPCGRQVSIFILPMQADDLRQVAADAALEQQESDT